MTTRLIPLFAVLAAVTACEAVADPVVCPLGLTVTPAAITLLPGDTALAHASVGACGVSSNAVAWRTADTTVVAVVPRGDTIARLRALGTGTSVVTAVSLRDSTKRVALLVTVPALGRDTTAPFQTDSLRYTLRPTGGGGIEATIGVVFTNPRTEPVYIVNCNGSTSLSLEKSVDGVWLRAWTPAIPACLSPPIVVQAGARYSMDVWLFGGDPAGNQYPRFDVAYVPGIYRIVYHDVLRTYSTNSHPFGEQIPLEQRVSNRFELRIAP